MSGVLLRDIVDGLRVQPLRSLLAIAAVAVGAATASLLTTVLFSLENTSQRLIQELGANTVAVVADASTSNQGALGPSAPHSVSLAKQSLDQAHAGLLRANIPGVVVAAVARSRARTLGSDSSLQVVATDQFLAYVRDWEIVDGRFLDQGDLHAAARHAVLTERLATRWQWRVGHVVMLGDTPFLVVGIVRVQGGALAGQFGDPSVALGERLVFVPHTVSPDWEPTASAQGGRKRRAIDAVFLRSSVSTRDTEGPQRSSADLVASARNLLLQGLEQSPSVSFVTPSTLVSGIRRLQVALGGTIAIVSGLCLALGGTTLMSLMVSNIRERTSEIGLRKTLGATRGDVMIQFLAEAALLTLGGGLVGAAIARGLVPLLRRAVDLRIESVPASWLVPVAVSVLLGLIFTYAPARFASRIEPALALRAEGN